MSSETPRLALLHSAQSTLGALAIGAGFVRYENAVKRQCEHDVYRLIAFHHFVELRGQFLGAP